MTAAVEGVYQWFFRACLFSPQGWGLIDLPLRATFSPAHPLARRDVPLARARAFQFAKPLFREWPRLPFTARIERAQFHRARSASKEGTWPLPTHPSQAARCASTGIVPATPPIFQHPVRPAWWEGDDPGFVGREAQDLLTSGEVQFFEWK